MSKENNMEFVDKMAEGARDIADTVVRATGDLFEKGKKSIELSKLRDERRDTLIALGEMTYNIEKGYGSEAAKNDLVAKMDELVQQINDIEAQRQAERQQREDAREADRVRREADRAQYEAQQAAAPVCGHCGQARTGSLPYCGYCGAKFE